MTPALLITMSMRPNRSTAVATSASAPPTEATSLVSATAVAARLDDAGHGRRAAGPSSAPDAVHRSAEVVDDDAGAPLGEQARVGQADAAPRPGDDGDASVEVELAQAGTGAFDPEQPGQRAADDGGPLVGGKVAELGGDELPAPAERPLGVGIVVAPHDGRQPGDVPAGDGHRVVLERDVELALARTRSASAGRATSR